MTSFWLLSLAFAVTAGMAGGLASCYQEQGDREQARTASVITVSLLSLALGAAGAAWSFQ